MTKRHLAVSIAALVLIVGVVAGRERPALELIQERAPKVAAADDGIDLDRLRRGESSLPQTDPFRNLGGNSAAPASVSAQPREKPVAPALPFRYFGKLIENGKTEVFVMRGDDLVAVAPGQTLGEYRVEQVDSRSISFTYLPLKTRQTLELQ
jgi:hypothetical protein